MSPKTVGVVSLFAIFLTGCSSTSLDMKIGEPILDTKSLVGIWVDERGSEVRIENAGGDMLLGGKLEFNQDKLVFEAVTGRIWLTRVDKAELLLLAHKDVDEFYFSLIEERGLDRIVLRKSDDKVFRKAISEGMLQGKLIGTGEDARGVLSVNTRDFATFLTKMGVETCFPAVNAGTLKRKKM